MEMIETYVVSGIGYHPFLIREGWQLAQLNYIESQHIDQIFHLDVHRHTDEVFVLIKGQAVLIGATIHNGEPIFEAELMRSDVIYNIPQGRWHNIAMEEGSEVLIAEKSNTHVSDFEQFQLNKTQVRELRNLVKKFFDSEI
ncbi:hypothetical protein D2U88_07145 [Flagellimonas aequoris]|uniref:Cupin domain-containing protein n=2 Tax=Flavobacteriales TaxID=200644 RepID=A0A418N855_9FLAO|nr:hypothetical protein D2U88_07145 [Allomuricauda aequoris]TXK03098.1 cupin domain-containing protein [Allomuricauda aequoris]